MHEDAYFGLFLILQSSFFIPECDEHLKPKVGMTFEGLEAVEKFYKEYAHQSGFGVRIGQQKKIDNKVVRTKRFMCNREGFKAKDSKETNDPLRKRRKQTDTRCGCDVHIFVRLCGGNTYKIDSLIEHHVHGLVSPKKRHLSDQIIELVRGQKILYTHVIRQVLERRRHTGSCKLVRVEF